MARGGSESLWFWGILAGIGGIALICSLILNWLKTIEKLRLNRKSDLDSLETKLNEKEIRLGNEREAIDILYKEKSHGFPWLANAYAEYQSLIELQIAKVLETKKHPAKKSAEVLREISSTKREIVKKFKITKSLLEMYESLFPFLIDFKGEDLDDYLRVILQENRDTQVEDEVIIYTTPGERETLTKQELFQRALDRYWQKTKSPWELGRDCERFIGYLYEKEGYSVYYQGIVEGFEDLGRDLIAKRDNEIAVIQCKRWSQYKVIHEKHICQLFGTTLKYYIENQHSLIQNKQSVLFPELMKLNKIKGVFITTTSLSPKAREFAEALGIIVKEKYSFEKYPSIKCNISRSTNEKIYHLPFDQQYDKTIIELERNECFVERISDAEGLGFRRAFRWKGNKDTKQP
jgi:hypothetical protein